MVEPLMDDRVTEQLDSSHAVPEKKRPVRLRSLLALGVLFLISVFGYGALFWVFNIWSQG